MTAAVDPLATRDLTIALPDGREMRAVLCLPTRPQPHGGWPAVIVLHEIFGLAPDIRVLGQRFAEHGMVAVIPDLFSAGTKVGCLARSIKEVASHQPGPVTADIDAVRAWAAQRPEVDGDRLAVVGFCLGGAFALLLGSLAPPGLRAVAANYGDLPKDLTRCPPVVASYGGRDRSLAKKAPVLEQQLTAAGVEHDVKTYPEAGHSFMTEGKHPVFSLVSFPLHAGYVKSASDDAWGRLFDCFDRWLATD